MATTCDKIEYKEADCASAIELYESLSDKDRVFLPHFEKPNGWIIGAYAGTRLVGVITGNVWDEHFVSCLIMVHPEYRRRGIGRKLAEMHMVKAREHKLAHFSWMCHKCNVASISIIRSLGGIWMDEENDWERYSLDL